METKLFADLGDRDVLAKTAAVAIGKCSQIANGFLYGEGGNEDVNAVHDEKEQWLAELEELHTRARRVGGSRIVYRGAYLTVDHIEQVVVGIRPGEKIHEMLLSEEESLHAVATPGGWVIEPEIRSWERPAWEGEPVPEGWCYTSDKNPESMSESDLIDSFKEMERGLMTV